MESTLLIAAILIVSAIACYGYYLTLKKERNEFEVKRSTKTEYRTNEEFIKS